MEPIELIVTLDEEGVVSGVAKVKDELGKIPGLVDQFGRPIQTAEKEIEKAAVQGSGHFRVLGLAARKLSEEMGVPARAAHELGNKVTDMAKNSLPGWGLALAGATIAVGAITMATQHFIEKKEEEAKARQENIERLRGELSEADQLLLKTREVIAAKEQEASITKRLLVADLPKQIESETEQLKKLEKKLKDIVTGDYQSSFKHLFDFRPQKEILQETLNEVDKLRSHISTMKAELQGVQGKGTKTVQEETNPNWKEDLQREAAGINDLSTAYIRQRDERIQMDQAMLESARARGASSEEINRLELQVFDDTTSKMILIARTRDEAEAQYDARKTQRATITAQKKKQIDQMSALNSATIAREASQVFDQLYALDNGRMKAMFYAARGAAAAEAYFQYQLAAAKSVGEMGPFGIGMSTYFEALSYVKPALILATAFEGPGGGGSSAVPTFAANPTTGLPENGGYRYYSYEQSHYGSGWRPGEGPSGGDTYVVHGDVYAQDGDAFRKKVVGAFGDDVRQRGDSLDIIQKAARR